MSFITPQFKCLTPLNSPMFLKALGVSISNSDSRHGAVSSHTAQS